MSITNLLTIIKAWPTREERLRKGLVKTKPVDEPDKPIVDDSTEAQRKAAARLLKLRSAQRKRRRAVENKQHERKNVPEVKL